MMGAGSLLIATPQISTGLFRGGVVVLVDHDSEGSVGVVLNQPTPELVVDHLGHLKGDGLDDERIFLGGPVQPEVGVCLAVGQGTFKIEIPGLSAGLIDITKPPGFSQRWRVYAGYAGWSPGQLVSEVDEGGWWVADAERDDLLYAEPRDLWKRVVARQKGSIAMFAHFPSNPRIN